MCTAPVWCQVSQRIMKEECEKHETEWHTATMFNTLTLTLNQVWHHVIITNCHSIHHKHSNKLSKTIRLIKWCYTKQNGQFYNEPRNRWVQYSWLAESNNPSSIITWKFHSCFRITRAAYTSKYSQSKIHQQLHNYICTTNVHNNHCTTLYSYCTW
jgi:hypothetical protein